MKPIGAPLTDGSDELKEADAIIRSNDRSEAAYQRLLELADLAPDEDKFKVSCLIEA